MSESMYAKTKAPTSSAIVVNARSESLAGVMSPSAQTCTPQQGGAVILVPIHAQARIRRRGRGACANPVYAQPTVVRVVIAQ